MRTIELRPINDIIAEVLEDANTRKANALKSIEEDTKQTIELIESTRQAAALLDAAGFDLYLPGYSKGARVTLDLGFFPQTKKGKAEMARAVKKVREALGVKKLTVGSKDVADEKRCRVEVRLKAAEFPGVTIAYQRKLAPGAKCRIVKHRSSYTSLVCNNV